MNVRLLSRAVVRQLLPIERCIPLMRHALTCVARKQAIQPMRQAIRTSGAPGLLGIMPGYTSDPAWLGVKAVSVFEGNFGTALGSHQGAILLFDTRTGSLRAILDAEEITAVRTAATSAVATDVLARPDATSIGICGYGLQAAKHLHAIAQVRRLTRAVVWGRDFSRARDFAKAQSTMLGLPVEAVDRPEAAAQADILCTTTSAAEPFLRGAWLRTGQHLNLVGASLPDAAEADMEVVRRSRYFGDDSESTKLQAGEWRRARAAGIVEDDHLLGSIGEVIDGRIRGRTSPLDITVFRSLGMIAEDLIAASYVLAEAERSEAGNVVNW